MLVAPLSKFEPDCPVLWEKDKKEREQEKGGRMGEGREKGGEANGGRKEQRQGSNACIMSCSTSLRTKIVR